MRYKAILFDNDDTLMDFQAGNRIAVNQLMDELGYFHPDRYEAVPGGEPCVLGRAGKGRDRPERGAAAAVYQAV